MPAARRCSTACRSASTASAPATSPRRRRSASTTAKSEIAAPAGYVPLSSAHCLDRLGDLLPPDELVARGGRPVFDPADHHAAVGPDPAGHRPLGRCTPPPGARSVGANRPDRPVHYGAVPALPDL